MDAVTIELSHFELKGIVNCLSVSKIKTRLAKELLIMEGRDKKAKFEQKQKSSVGNIPSFEEIQAREKRDSFIIPDDKKEIINRVLEVFGYKLPESGNLDEIIQLEADSDTGEVVGMTQELPEMIDKDALFQSLADLPDNMSQRIFDDIEIFRVFMDRIDKLEMFCENAIEAVKDKFGDDSVLYQAWRLSMDKYYEDYGVENTS